MLPLICLKTEQRLSNLLGSKAFPVACWIAFRVAIRHLKKYHPVRLSLFVSELRQIWLLDLFITRHHNIPSYPTPNCLQLCYEKHCSFICLLLCCSSTFIWLSYRIQASSSVNQQDNFPGHLELNLCRTPEVKQFLLCGFLEIHQSERLHSCPLPLLIWRADSSGTLRNKLPNAG